MNTVNFFKLLAFAGLGWKDIHASNIETPSPSAIASTTTCLEYLDRNQMMSSLKQVLSGRELLSLVQDRAKRLIRGKARRNGIEN